MSEDAAFYVTILIFALTYLGLALGKIPGLRTDRAGIALSGAAAVLASGLLSFEEAVKAIDFATLVLLFGMMIVVAFLRRAGFFRVVTQRAIRSVQQPATFLAALMFVSGLLSALLVNDVVCLALTPLVLHLARDLDLDPKPPLIGLAVASNIGSTATLTGNPQNMIIGELSHISYLRFALMLTPVALLGLLTAYTFTSFIYRSALRTASPSLSLPTIHSATGRPLHRAQRLLLGKSLLLTGGVVVLFFLGAPLAIVAVAAASILLLSRLKPAGIYRQVDWSLLVMFAGLFVVVHAFEVHVLRQAGVENWASLREHPVSLLSVASAALSNVVSNVPAVLLFKPIIVAMPAEVQERAWLALAMSSTLAGNLTVLGSVANLIVVENAEKEGVRITFVDYCWVGVPVTLLTLLIGIGWLCWI